MRNLNRTSEHGDETLRTVGRWIPVTVVVSLAVITAALRIETGVLGNVSDAAFLLLALAAYIVASAILLTEIKVPSSFLARLGNVTVMFGVYANLCSWLFRWIIGYERELAVFVSEGRDVTGIPWILRYIPFANLYDMSVAFAFGAAVTSLFLLGERRHRIVSAFSLPLAALILTLARFIGDGFVDLPPVLDSVWRPIHVGTASISYGMALVCFAVAVLFLIKDGIDRRWVIFWTGVFGTMVLLLVGDLHLLRTPFQGVYPIGLEDSESGQIYRLRADLNGIGWLHLVTLIATITSTALAALVLRVKSERLDRIMLNLAGLSCGLVLVLIISIFTSSGIAVGDGSRIADSRLMEHGKGLVGTADALGKDGASVSDSQILQTSQAWVDERREILVTSLRANPVENVALVCALLLSSFAFVTNLRWDSFRAFLPESKDLDELTYKLGALSFIGLGVLLATGAVWANESWGRYWGWDAKEVGALCAWLTYAAFLHARITRGWQGRRSAYFAVLAFIFVVFTYLGVSYLLPGLHSYA